MEHTYLMLMEYMWVVVAIAIGLAVATATIITTAIIVYRKNRQADRELEAAVKRSADEARKKSNAYMERMRRDNLMNSARIERDYEQTKALVRGNLYAPDYRKANGEDIK